MKIMYFLILVALILITMGCARKVLDFEDDEGNRVTQTYSERDKSFRTTKTKINISALNLNSKKISDLVQQLPQMNKTNANDFEGFKIYVKDLSKGSVMCFASVSPGSIDSVKILLSRGKGIVEPVYNYLEPAFNYNKNDIAGMVPMFSAANKIIKGLNGISLNVYDAEKTVEYDKILRKKQAEVISEKAEWLGGGDSYKYSTAINTYTLRDKSLLDTLSDKIGKIDYIVMPNSEVPAKVVNAVIRKFNAINRDGTFRSPLRFVAPPDYNPGGRILYGMVFVSADTIRNIDTSIQTFQSSGLYRESLLTVGCTDGKADSIVAMMKYLKKELQLSGTQKSKAIGE